MSYCAKRLESGRIVAISRISEQCEAGGIESEYMARPILLDTDVFIDFLRGHSKAVAFINSHADQIMISSIVVAELYAGVRSDAEQAVLEKLISIFRVIPVSAKIAKTGGLYKRDYSKSHRKAGVSPCFAHFHPVLSSIDSR